jgi:hypothetical protein
MGDENKPVRQRIEGTVYRDAEVRANPIIDEDERRFRISVSSETPVTRASFFREPWVEVLGHKRAEVNLDRLNDGAPLLYNHDSFSRENRIGVVESATLKNRRIEAVVRLSKREDVDDIWQDIRDGVLRNISVGYSINERTLTREGKGEPSEYRITDWTPFEVSAVPIPADSSVGLGRGLEEGEKAYRVIDLVNEDRKLSDKDDKKTVDGKDPETATRSQPDPAPASPAPAGASVVELDAARDEGVTAERSRVSEINEAFAPYPQFNETRAKCIEDGASVDASRKLLLAEIGKGTEPVSADAVRTEAGEDSFDKFARAATCALAVRANMADENQIVEVGKTGLRGHTLYELARRSLELSNVDTSRMDKMTLVGRAFTTSDFPTLLADVANKSMLKGFDEAPETWNVWAQTGSLSDFKTSRRVTLSSFNDLEMVNEDGEYKYGSFQDGGENITLATYGKLFAISRQAIINDDMGAFSRIPSAMGRAASRVVGDLAYGVITSNPLLSDGIALFAGTAIGTQHGNLNIGGAAALATAPIQQMRTAMGRQSDISGSATALNIRPSYLLVPMALEDTARVLMESNLNPEEGGTTSFRAPNTIRNLANVVTDARLDIDSVTAYYLAAGQQFDTVEVAFLDGNQAPMLEQQAGWSIDGTEFKVRIDVAAAPMEFRTWQKNDGV